LRSKLRADGWAAGSPPKAVSSGLNDDRLEWLPGGTCLSGLMADVEYGSMKAWRIATLAYAMLYFVLVSAMEAENISQSYPMIYVGFSMIAQVLVVLGAVLFGLNLGAGFAKLWQRLFPLLVLELLVGLWFDTTIPPDAFEPGWVLNVGLSLWLMAPAYYFNFRVARYRAAEREP
jgi:hypothetical protein